MLDCLLLIERGGDASLDVVSQGYVNAVRHSFQQLRAALPEEKKFHTASSFNQRAIGYSDTEMDITLTSVVLATSFERCGLDFVVYDDENIVDKYKPKLESEISSGVKFVCISTTYFWSASYLQQVIDFFHERDASIRIIVGGQGLAVWDQKTIARLNHVYCFYKGDADYFGETLVQLIHSEMPNGFKEFSTATGAKAYECNNFESELDQLPIPDWGLLRSQDFNDKFYHSNPLPSRVPFEERRGCVFRCSFCSYHSANVHRQKSGPRMVQELEQLRLLGITKVNFTGAEFLAPPKKSREVLRHIIDADLGMDLAGYARIDILNKQPGMIRLMKDAGFTAAYFGVETGDETILKAMNKKFSLKKSLPHVLDELKQLNIDVWASFLFGYPGETQETAKNTTDFIVGRNFTYVDLHALQVVPGTPLDINREKYGLKTLGNFWAHKTMSIREIPELMRKVFVDIYPNCDSKVLNIQDDVGKFFSAKDSKARDAILKALHDYVFLEYDDRSINKQKRRVDIWEQLTPHIEEVPVFFLETSKANTTKW